MYAKLIDHMGDDLKVANSARASFGTKSEWDYKDTPNGDGSMEVSRVLKDKDANLIRYLARGCPSKEMEEIIDTIYDKDGLGLPREEVRRMLNDYRGKATHWVPFAHCQLTFEVSMPIFVARQLIRHTVGVSISEMSRRYVSENPDYWFPELLGWRLKADNVKQGSSADVLLGGAAIEVENSVKEFCLAATDLYRKLVDEHKVAPELARMILPQNTYTDWTWTISLVTAARVCHQRLDPHAQKEIQVLAQQVYDACMERFPVSFKALMDYGTEA